MPNERVTEINDEVYLWLQQRSSIHLKAVSSFGDPVELTASEALQLANALQSLAEDLEHASGR
jgi:hypothetical protein